MADAIYPCPFGCAGAKKPITSVAGWKRHMSSVHKGWDDGQLAIAVAAANIPPASGDPSVTGKEAFLKENSAEPIQADRPAARSTEEVEAQKTVELKTDAVGKKFNQKLNKMKRNISEKLPKALGKAVAEKGPEWALDNDDMELLTESIENCFDVLDVDFRITPFSTTLSNPLWVLLLPILALILVFAPKGVAVAQKAQKEKKENEEGVAVHTD